MSQNKKIAKNSLILYFRLLITSIIGLITTRIIVQNLGASDYGLYSVVGSVVVMMNFLTTVMVSTTYRYIAFEMGRDDGKYVNKVFNISLLIHIGIAFLVILLAETVGVWYIHNQLNVETGKISDAIFVFRLSILATIINIYSIPFQGFITAIEKFSVSASIEILRSAINLIFVIILAYYLGNKLRFYAVSMTVLALIPSLLFIGYCKIKYTAITSWNIQKDIAKYKEMVAYSGWIMIGAGAYVGKSTGSALIINSFFGTVINAAFGIANNLNNLITMVGSNLGQAAIPQIMKSYSGGDNKRTLHLVAYTSKYTFFLMFIPALPLLLETEYLLKLWLGDIPEYTVIFSKLMIINVLIDALFTGIPAAVQATGKIKWFQIILSSMMLLGLPISYILLKFGYQPYSIQIAYIVIAIANIFVGVFLLKKLINFDIVFLLKTSYFRITIVFLAILPLFFVKFFFIESFLRFLLSSIISVSCLIITIFLIGLENNERDVVRNMIRFMKYKLHLFLNSYLKI